MSDVLRRKLGASRPPKQAGAISVEALLRKTMPRDADAVLSLDLSVTGFTSVGQDRSEVLESIAPTDLTYLVEAEDGARGLAILDAGLVAALIEVQVSGTVSNRPFGERRPTRTDGIVAGEVVDKWLTSAGEAVGQAGLDGAWPMMGFERVPGVLSLRETALLLEPVGYRSFEIALSLGAGAKTGLLRLIAPRRRQTREGCDTTTAARVRRHLPALSVEIQAVLARLPLGMMQASGLQTDQLIPLPKNCLQHVRLETSTGRLIREARLGQLDGRKAVRLFEPSAASVTPTPLAPPPSTAEPPELPDAHIRPDQPPEADVPEPLPAGEGLPSVGDLPELPSGNELPDLPDLPDWP